MFNFILREQVYGVNKKTVAILYIYSECILEGCPEIMPWFIYLNGKLYSGKTEDTRYMLFQI